MLAKQARFLSLRTHNSGRLRYILQVFPRTSQERPLYFGSFDKGSRARNPRVAIVTPTRFDVGGLCSLLTASLLRSRISISA